MEVATGFSFLTFTRYNIKSHRVPAGENQDGRHRPIRETNKRIFPTRIFHIFDLKIVGFGTK